MRTKKNLKLTLTKKRRLSRKTKRVKGGGRPELDLSNTERNEILKNFSPIFDLNDESTYLSPEVLSSAIDKIIEKAELYITKEKLHKIPILANNNVNRKKFMLEKNLPAKYNDNALKYFKNILENIKIGFTERRKTLTIEQFNVISLQLVVLFTEIILLLINTQEGNKAPFESILLYNMEKLVGNKDYTLSINMSKNSPDIFDDYYNDKNIKPPNYMNYDLCYKTTKISSLYSILGNHSNNINPNDLIILFLGEIDINDLTKAFIKQIYVLGMTMEMEYADTFYTTPLGFIEHDISHMVNRQTWLKRFTTNTEEKKTIFENEKNFMKYLENGDNGLTKDNIYDICLIFFLIVHESELEYLFLKNDIGWWTWNITIPQIEPINSWIKNGSLTGLLPENRSISVYVEDKHIQVNLDDLRTYSLPISYDDDDLYDEYLKYNNTKKQYLKDAKNLFTTTWNNFFATKK